MIIVYGGTFNPPTLAHEKIAKLIIKKYKPDKFIFLPVGDNYTWKDNFANFIDRKKMLEIAFKEEMFIISSLENNEEYKGTYWALNQIEKAYKKDVYFIIGADNLEELDKWINYENLLKEYKFIVLTRKGYDLQKTIKEKYLKYQNSFLITEIEINISSTQFRNDLQEAKILNKDVYKYIVDNNMYGVNDVKA